MARLWCSLSQLVIIVACGWICSLILLSFPLIHNSCDSSATEGLERRLTAALGELDMLQHQNKELKYMLHNISR